MLTTGVGTFNTAEVWGGVVMIYPVNEDNAPGVIAMNPEELMEAVRRALDKNYRMEDEKMNKYKQINQFDDRQNTSRIIQDLRKMNIL